ncbi:MAG: orotate phosphoribosyltransferase [Gammaproteobacteria bacterium]|nr:MAG: orotate phosphoribosyltransferase [Gammaproteobacteria bacterium]
MQDYQREFIQFALEQEVLCFGHFQLKSGRESPYFFNSGLFNSGAALDRLGDFYAQAITAADVDFDMIFGPAYKGIPLVAATAIALNRRYDRDLPYCFNRKEAKDHGEGGRTVGAPLRGRILIIDDVVSAGTSVRESLEIIEAGGAQAVAVAVALDREERGAGQRSAIGELRAAFGLQTVAIAGLGQLIEFLASAGGQEEHLQALEAYRARYGVAAGSTNL